MRVQKYQFFLSFDERVVTCGKIIENALQSICQRVYFAKFMFNLNAGVTKPLLQTLVHIWEARNLFKHDLLKLFKFSWCFLTERVWRLVFLSSRHVCAQIVVSGFVSFAIWSLSFLLSERHLLAVHSPQMLYQVTLLALTLLLLKIRLHSRFVQEHHLPF